LKLTPGIGPGGETEGGDMAVRAKFVVTELKKSLWPGSSTAPTESVVLAPATGEDNKTWARYTPCGRIEMQIDNPPALEQFHIGQTFFVDFTPAPPAEKDEK
jgi:hypothetical protein